MKAMHQAGPPILRHPRHGVVVANLLCCDSLSVRLLQRLAVVVVPPRALSSSTLLLLLGALVAIVAAVAAGAAQARAVLLVPGAQRLSAKHEVFILDDDGLDPRLGVEVKLVG